MKPIQEVPTIEMIIPVVPEGFIIFDLRNQPGMISVGTRGHFALDKVFGYAPYEIDLDTAIQWLNDKHPTTGEKASLRYCEEWTEADHKMLLDIREDQEEFCKEFGMTPEEWQETLVSPNNDYGDNEEQDEDPYLNMNFDEKEEDFTPYRREDRRRKRAKEKSRVLNRRKAREIKEMRSDVPVLWDDYDD